MKAPRNIDPVFARIAKFVPDELQKRYWEFVALVCKIGPDDDVLLLVEAMGFMTLIVAAIPTQMTIEREALATTLEAAAKRMEHVREEVILAAVRSARVLRTAVRHERSRMEKAFQDDLREIKLERHHMSADHAAFLQRLDERHKKLAIGLGVVWALTLGIVYFIASSHSL